MSTNGSSPPTVVEIDGRELRLTNLDKVLYPETGTTKAEVVQYYVAVADALLPVVRDRPVTRKRWPDGVGHEPFFEKNLPKGTPDWVARMTQRHTGTRSGRGERALDYPLVDDVATLVWLAQSGALELHVPQWRVDRASGRPLPPDRFVVDLDPGAPAGLDECAEVALVARRMLDAHGLPSVAVLSGSQGIQLYAPLPPATDAGRAVLERAGSPAEYARALGVALERQLPSVVVTEIAREKRPGRVYVDWSQNNPAKTTIAPWSLRGRSRPTAAVPVAWDDVERGGLTQCGLADAVATVGQRRQLLEPLGG